MQKNIVLNKNAMNFLNLETQKIPKLIWQTSKSTPHYNTHSLILSWINKNPDYEWLFMDDELCDTFIKDNFNNDFYKMYASLPIGVMKADVWRVAVIYVYGGLYVDTDCECVKPINTWINNNDELIVGVEVDGGDLLNYAFAAMPKHPALLSVLNRFYELYNDNNFMKDKTSPIQNFGQYGFSDGVLRYYGMNDKELMKLGGISNYYNENTNNVRFILQQDKQFTNEIYPTSLIVHHAASLKWRNYNSWRLEQRKYLNETN